MRNSEAALNAIFISFKGTAWVDMDGLRKPQNRSNTPHAHERSHPAESISRSAPTLPSKPEPVRTITTAVDLPKGYLETLERRRYSENTVRQYCSHFTKFLDHFGGRDPEAITEEEINAYLLYLVNERKVSQICRMVRSTRSNSIMKRYLVRSGKSIGWNVLARKGNFHT
ncbi:MAG: phage integrase N-terminal SAM-like domain-containing protein [Flavobacteriales bacterium]|nr:phage integrase N-terminal SAM-like domain-containing protein [Flavobacteriales bacterium]